MTSLFKTNLVINFNTGVAADTKYIKTTNNHTNQNQNIKLYRPIPIKYYKCGPILQREFNVGFAIHCVRSRK